MNGRARGKWWERIADNRETLSTVLMGVSAVITTWCAFESTKWSGIQTIRFNEAAAARVESTRSEIAGNQYLQVDLATFIAWIQLLQTEQRQSNSELKGPYRVDPASLSGFFYERFRPEFRPAVQAWLATRPFVSEDAPATPFQMKEYPRPQTALARELSVRSEEKGRAAREANRTGNNYMLTTVLSALVAFFAGMSTKSSGAKKWSALFWMACLALMLCTVILLNLPVLIF